MTRRINGRVKRRELCPPHQGKLYLLLKIIFRLDKLIISLERFKSLINRTNGARCVLHTAHSLPSTRYHDPIIYMTSIIAMLSEAP